MQRFPRTARLRTPDDFERVRQEGCACRRDGVVVACRPGRVRRLGLVVSKRVGNAPERNRIKRVVREYFRKDPERFPRGDCVVIATTGLGERENDAIRAALDAALAALRRRCKGRSP